MSRRHTNAEVRAGIAALESRGWSINTDGTITRVTVQAKTITHDPRTNGEPRHPFWWGRKTYSIKVADLIEAKFGLAAKERPNEAEVGLGLDSEPARVGSRPAGRGPCGHCGGFMVRGDDNEHRCLQCGRANTPQRVLTAEESRWFRRERKVGEL